MELALLMTIHTSVNNRLVLPAIELFHHTLRQPQAPSRLSSCDLHQLLSDENSETLFRYWPPDMGGFVELYRTIREVLSVPVQRRTWGLGSALDSATICMSRQRALKDERGKRAAKGSQGRGRASLLILSSLRLSFFCLQHRGEHKSRSSNFNSGDASIKSD